MAMGISELGFSWVYEGGGVGYRWIRAHPTVLIHDPREMVLDQSKRSTPLMILRPFKLVIID